MDAQRDIDGELLQAGRALIGKQKAESFWDAWRKHWPAAAWSMVLSTALIMEGYDTAVINSFFGQPQFAKRFGVKHGKKYLVPAKDQTALSNLATCGQLVGLVITGYCQERFGMKRTYIGGMALMIVTIFVAVFAKDLPMLMAAEFLMGCPWGMFQTLTTAYASEICPISMRGYLAAYASVGWGAGKFIATGVLRGALGIKGDWAWRMPYAVQWVWPAPLLVACLFAKESPWWLVRKGRYDEAEVVISKMATKGTYDEGEAAAYVEYMKHTDAIEKAEKSEGKWNDLFRGSNLRRTEIQAGVWMIQNWNGSAIYSLAVVFLENAGMSTVQAFNLNIVLQAFGIVGVMISWVFLRYAGRRPIYIWGIVASVVANIIIGVLGTTHKTASTSKAIGALMVIVNLTFHMSIGPVCYTVVGEIPASRLRARSIAFGRFVYVVNGIIVATINPYMQSATAWNWKAKAGYFWAGTGALCIIWAYFRLPETKDRSFAEIDLLFAQKVPTRKFAKTLVREDTFDGPRLAEGDVKADQDDIKVLPTEKQ